MPRMPVSSRDSPPARAVTSPSLMTSSGHAPFLLQLEEDGPHLGVEEVVGARRGRGKPP